MSAEGGNLQTSPSRINSILAWTKVPNFWTKAAEATHNDVCAYCHGLQEITDDKLGLLYCVCALKEFRSSITELQRTYGSPYQIKTLEDFSLGSLQNDSYGNLKEFKKILTTWISKPDIWLVMTGNPGCGKTLALQIIQTTFSDWSFYITESDLNSKVMTLVGNSDALREFIDLIKNVPILLIDDIGSGYRRAGNETYATSVLREVIQWRYEFAEEFITKRIFDKNC
jgi:DNA replication protein DnaC